MSNNTVSVIVPIYNAEKHIKKTIESIMNQSYENIELILVNDGSTDDSFSIIKKYEKYDNVIIISKENGGVSDSRNVGISKATGDYIMFVDSDDYLEIDMIEQMVKNATDNNVDIVRCNYSKLSDNTKTDNKIPEIFIRHPKIDKLDFDNILYNNFFNNHTWYSVWGQLIRRSCIKDCKFRTSLSIGEDLMFNLSIYQNANGIYFLNKSLYNYVCNDNGITRSKSTDKLIKKMQDSLVVYTDIYDRFKNKEEVQDAMLERFVESIVLASYKIIQSMKNTQKKNSYKVIDNYFESKLMIIVHKKKIYNKLKISKRILYILLRHKMYFVIRLLTKCTK